MTRRRRLGMATVFALAVALSLPAAPQTAVQLEGKLAQEKDPVKRAALQMRLAEFCLDDARKLYEEGTSEKGLAKLNQMMRWVTGAHDELFATGRDPRKKPKGFKEAEIKLREISRQVEDLKLSMPVDDREQVDEILEKLTEVRDHLLHGIMRVSVDKTEKK